MTDDTTFDLEAAARILLPSLYADTELAARILSEMLAQQTEDYLRDRFVAELEFRQRLSEFNKAVSND